MGIFDEEKFEMKYEIWGNIGKSVEKSWEND
jgi:hypothetical protein